MRRDDAYLIGAAVFFALVGIGLWETVQLLWLVANVAWEVVARGGAG